MVVNIMRESKWKPINKGPFKITKEAYFFIDLLGKVIDRKFTIDMLKLVKIRRK
jgi:hypothetical protein